MEWVSLCSDSEVSEGELLPVDTNDKCIMVVRISGQLYAADRICSHEDMDMSGGFVSEEGVRCPLHLSVFDMTDGQPQNPPAQDPIITYNLKIENGTVWIEI